MPPPADAASTTPRAGAAPVVQGDWLASVCPYLTSEDGTYRSAAPDEGHRCTAQDPAATLPLAFQERFCLTDRHPRCEMYKFAQETDSTGSIPVDQVPPTDPPTARTSGGGDGGSQRTTLAMLGAVGGAVALIVVLVLLMGSCSADEGATDDPAATSEPQATEGAAVEPDPTPDPTPEPEPTPEPDPDATPAEEQVEPEAAAITILYEIQPDEALAKVSETFGVSRNRLRRDNPGLEDIRPADMPGTIIEITLPDEMTLEEVEALPGFQGVAP